MSGDVWITQAELAQRLKVSSRYVRSQVNAGVWPARRLGKLLRFTDADLLEIEALSAQPVRGKRSA